MRHSLIILFFLVVSCAGDEANISKLTAQHQSIFRVAADFEGVEIVKNGNHWTWKVEYENLPDGIEGRSDCGDRSCIIKISQQQYQCPNGGRDRRFYITARHELRHAKGEAHSTDPDSLMHPRPKCDSDMY